MNKQMILVNDLSPYDIAYLAGLFDGEGCVRVALMNRGATQKRRQRKVIYLGIEVANTYEPIMYWLQTNFGGHVYKVKRNKRTDNTCWSWHLHGDSLKLLLSLIIPYSRIKKEELLVLLEAVNMKRGLIGKPHPESYYEKVRELSAKAIKIRKAKLQPQCHPKPKGND